MKIQTVFIVGSGLMGSGIAQVCAQAGLRVILCDVAQGQLDKALQTISWSAGKFIEKGAVEGTLDQVMNRVSTTTGYVPAAEADLVLEAVFENIDIKRDVLEKLKGVVRPDALIATNTSAIPITELAASVDRPQRFLGLHFFSPVPMMKAVEVIRGMFTSDETLSAARELAVQIGKDPIMVNRDVAGFVINRINFPSTIEAMRLVEAGVATVEDIDKGLRLASGRRMGIFETGDMVGLDVTYGALMAMYRETGEERWYPPLLLRRKVKAGQLGRKTGVGWYRYDKDGNRLGPAEL
ncbi:MAG: 3-hydroxyacyl-CoA dehydrogenase family protein [Deltaproteobacteria bacterium]|nr:3-hydroxyacyl-CoA dehydrogenase family protein [Deltaproteobacteria bacterium]